MVPSEKPPPRRDGRPAVRCWSTGVSATSLAYQANTDDSGNTTLSLQSIALTVQKSFSCFPTAPNFPRIFPSSSRR